MHNRLFRIVFKNTSQKKRLSEHSRTALCYLKYKDKMKNNENVDLLYTIRAH